ncbi:hypothetical protein PR001_g9043 [Phytophthora rubi]|uniref:Uncharacterized protein n=1 Tax=Phytophthora rubi TaxID=129364 RepID=A0A6A3MXV7_9STRA|nr:hypothetical protein PR002_g24477 [Phytophthora rubi]KAE9036025.1 hypothetical protein PR001_g9043 [Phytophthora rubi]
MVPNFLATATSTGEVTVIGMKEHVLTGRASSLAQFMTPQELVLVTLTQRVLAKPLRSPALLLLQLEKQWIRGLPPQCCGVLDSVLWLAPDTIFPHLKCIGVSNRALYLDL